ncbi:MFS transporter [Actibacterium ureilyticum]|uniref:MFS transporter n=1 Tax=Actibacterium ureilyticum TaxID=1590614 RepID=UPI000BAAAD20|nr:MFS transporter [Actibacterium ureilyticum]
MIVCIGILFFIWGVVGVIIGPLLPETTKAFSLGSTQAGFIFFTWSAGFSLGSFGARSLLERTRPDRLLGLLSLGAAICCGFLFLSGSFPQYLSSFALLGLSGGATFTVAHTLISWHFPARRASALSALDVVFSLGNMTSPLLLVALFSAEFSWQTPFVIVAIAFSAAATAFFLLMWSTGDVTPPSDTTHTQTPAAPPNKIRALLPLIILGMSSFFLGTVEWAQNIWFVSYAIELGVSEAFARISQSLFLFGMVMARLITIFAGNLVHQSGFLRMLFASTMAGNLLIVFVSTPWAFILGNVLMGLGIGAMFPIFLARAMDIDPARSANFSAIMIIFLATGGQVSSVVIGAISDLFSIRQTFVLSTFFSLALVLSFELYRFLTRAHHSAHHPQPVGTDSHAAE